MMMRVNLLQPRLPSREALARQRVRIATGVLVAFGAASVGVLAWILLSRWAISDQLSAVRAEIASEQAQVNEARELMSGIREADARTQLLQQLPQPEDRLAPVIAEISNAKPAGVQLQQVSIQTDGSVVIAGTAGSHQAVAEYLDRLRQLSGLAGVTFDSSTRASEEQGVAFILRGTMASSAESEGGNAQ